jgi:predicted CoA-binding protein
MTIATEFGILRRFKTIVVVGLSSEEWRPSYRVSRYMQEQGYRIIPVNPNETEVLGEKAYATISDVPEPADFVDVFRRPEFAPEVVDEAIAAGAKAVWLQQGIRSEEARRKAEEAGLLFVEDRCVLQEHQKMIRQGLV